MFGWLLFLTIFAVGSVAPVGTELNKASRTLLGFYILGSVLLLIIR